MDRYIVTYKQKFMGEILEDTYVTYAHNEEHMEEKMQALWDDPHVFSVEYKLANA